MGPLPALRSLQPAGKCTSYLLWAVLAIWAVLTTGCNCYGLYLQLCGYSGLLHVPCLSPQVVGALTVLMRRPHNTFANNIKTTVVQTSQAFTALAFLAGSLDLLPLPMADIAAVVMWSQIAAVAYIVFNQASSSRSGTRSTGSTGSS